MYRASKTPQNYEKNRAPLNLSTRPRFLKCGICPKEIKTYDRFKEHQHIQRPCHKRALKALKQDR